MFTNDWFEVTGIRNFEKYILPLNEIINPLHFLEIGCYEGQASVWLLEHISDAHLTVIDTFEGSKEHDAEFEKTLFSRFTKNIEPYKDRVVTFKGTSRNRLKDIVVTYDFIYIDGSHQASDVLEDAVLAFPLLKEGGIMIFDDYTWGAGMGYFHTPRAGIDAFIDIYGSQITVLEKNSQAIIKKNIKVPTQ